jgi:hypothetical protein
MVMRERYQNNKRTADEGIKVFSSRKPGAASPCFVVSGGVLVACLRQLTEFASPETNKPPALLI